MTGAFVVKSSDSYFPNECPCCGAKEIVDFGPLKSGKTNFFGPHKIEYAEAPRLCGCARCKSWFNSGILRKEKAYRLYSETDELRWDSTGFDKEAPKEIVDFFKSRLRPGMKVLDIGCNHGIFLDFAKSLGCETSGVELNKLSRELAAKKGHRIFPDIKEVGEQFDLVTGFDLLEHIYDLPGFFDSMKRVTRSGGTLAFFTGDIACFWARVLKKNFWYFQFPEHIVFPSRAFFELQEMFEFIGSTRSLHAKMPSNSFVKEIARVIYCILRGKWQGFGRLFPDHVLFELRNR